MKESHNYGIHQIHKAFNIRNQGEIIYIERFNKVKWIFLRYFLFVDSVLCGRGDSFTDWFTGFCLHERSNND